MERAREIEDRMRQLYGALERGEASVLADSFSDEDGVLLIGTDPNEWWDDHATIERVWEAQLGELGGLKVEDADPKAFATDDVGWIADHPTLRFADGSRVPLRLTGVFRREDGDWKVAQWHTSIGILNEDAFGSELTT